MSRKIDKYRGRRYNRLLHRFDEDTDKGHWVTTENNHKVFIDENGNPQKGNAHVISKMKNGEIPPQKAYGITKKRATSQFEDIIKKEANSDNYNIAPVRDILDQLPVGSVIEAKGVYDDEQVFFVREDENTWFCRSKRWRLAPDELAEQLIWANQYDSDNVPTVQRVSRSEESHEKQRERKSESNWRNKRNWADDESFDKKVSITMTKTDLDQCGDGFEITGSDGKVYTKFEGQWYEKDTYRQADKRRLKSPKIECDFFQANFGMNGVSSDECTKAKERYDSLTEHQKKVYEQVFRNASFKPATMGGSYCMRDSVYVAYGATADTIFHESSHAIDAPGSIDLTITSDYGYDHHITSPSKLIDYYMDSDSAHEDFESMASMLGIKTDGEGWFIDDDMDKIYRNKSIDTFFNRNSDIDGFDNVSDVIDAMTFGKIPLCYCYGGHGQSYWERPYGGEVASSASMEYWAEFCNCVASGYTKALELMSFISPNRYKACQKAYKEVFGVEYEG